MWLSLFTISLAVLFANCQNFLDCGPTYCTSKGDCPPLDCEDGRILKNATQCGCCGICIKNLKKDADCLTYGGNIENIKECGSGLVCNAIEGIKGQCVASECLTKAAEYEQRRNDTFFKVNFQCDYFGHFEPVVCIEGVLCFCVDKKGKRIFGTDYAENFESMNCNCSQDINDFPRKVDVEQLPRCLENGNYDPLQCVGERCFCMEPKSHHDDDDDIEVEMDKLPCYDSNRHKNKRQTDCLAERKFFRKENLTTIAVNDIQCDLDGSFSPAQPQGSSYSCVSITGTELDYQDKKDPVTCKCLRDQEIVQNSAGDVITKESKLKFLEIDCANPAESNNILRENFFEDFF